MMPLETTSEEICPLQALFATSTLLFVIHPVVAKDPLAPATVKDVGEVTDATTYVVLSFDNGDRYISTKFPTFSWCGLEVVTVKTPPLPVICAATSTPSKATLLALLMPSTVPPQMPIDPEPMRPTEATTGSIG
jgi:hypothetical protein